MKLSQDIRLDCQQVLKGREKQLALLKGETLVVTGGTGFIGTWLAEAVAALNDDFSFGIDLVLISRNTDGFRNSAPHLASRKDITLLRSDVRHSPEIPRKTKYLVHAAANPSDGYHSSFPIETLMTISNGTAAILKEVERCDSFKMFLNLSSGLVYGPQPLDLPRIPESFVGGPQSGSISYAYAEAKRFGETLCDAYRSQARLPTLSLRPFAFVGPYQSIESPWAINNFIHDAFSGKAIRVLGDGQSVRSYLYASDMAYWILRILTAGEAGMSYNLGSPEAITLAELASKVAQHFNPRPDILLQVAPASSTRRSRFVPDTTLACENFGLSVTVPLEEALEKTMRWHRERQKTTHES